MFETLTIPFGQSEADSGRGDTWARLEQGYKSSTSDAANLGDLSQMFALARTGHSAFEYVADVCPYAEVVENLVIVQLDFYVWPSDISLPYTLKADLGAISEAERVEEYRSFDVAFQGSDSENLPYIFNGSFVPEMPFISSAGEILAGVEAAAESSVLSLSESAYCVLRADGRVAGFKHTITMTLPKTSENKIENLRNTIVVSWLDETGEKETDTLELEIPPCVSDLLEDCPDGQPVIVIGCLGRNCDDKDPVYVVKYNVCDGHIISQGWEDQ